jgi:hypothetical protein
MGPTAQLGQDARPPERLFSTQSIAFLAMALFDRMSVTVFSLSTPALAPTETPPMRMRSVIVSPLVKFSKPIVPSAKPPPTSMTSESPPTLNEFTHQFGCGNGVGLGLGFGGVRGRTGSGSRFLGNSP